MNYQKIYNSLIERGQNRILKGYSERHHIIPRCLEGTDSKENLVRLTPEEHYVAHQLLVKMHPDHNGLLQAINIMSSKNNNNKMYGWLRREYSKSISGSGNHFYGKKHSEETKRRISEHLKNRERHPMTGITGKDHPRFGKRHSEETKKKMKKNSWMKGKIGNLSPMFGKRHSEETKKKIRLTSLGKRHSEETKKKISKISSKIIICIDNGIIYPSLKIAAKKLNIHHQNISSMLRKQRKTAGGYKFKYVE